MKSALGSFLFGLVLGGGLVYFGLVYHLVQSEDGFHLVPKLQPTFAESYVDVRKFSAADWANHRNLVMAIMQAKQERILTSSATEQMQQSVDQVLQGLGLGGAAPVQR